MRTFLLVFVSFVFDGASGPIFGAERPATAPLTFVTEYIRELAAIEDIRAEGEQELKQGTKDEAFSSFIHMSTLMKLELGFQIATLRGMRLKAPLGQLIPHMIDFYQKKIVIHQRLIEIITTLIAAPEPGVDYGKLSAQMPQLRAILESIDQTLLVDVTPAVFMSLFDYRPQFQDKVVHLVITKAERARLVEKLTNNFGSKLDQNEQNYTVSAASVLKADLLKNFKCSDDPWE